MSHTVRKFLSLSLVLCVLAISGLAQAQAALNARDYKTAIIIFTEIIASGRLPKSWVAPTYYMRGKAYRSSRQYKLAVEDYNAAVAADQHVAPRCDHHAAGHGLPVQPLAVSQPGLDRVHRAHLVRDRADAADARGDVGRLAEVAPAQKGLEEARRLVDLELHVEHAPAADLDEQAALALDAGQRADLDRACARGHAWLLAASAASRNGAAPVLNVRYSSATRAGVAPQARSTGSSAAAWGDSFGPKQP